MEDFPVRGGSEDVVNELVLVIAMPALPVTRPPEPPPEMSSGGM
jgi:hypothetical protein